MGGVDAIVFTGGVGENDFGVRHDVTAKVSKALGIEFDTELNNRVRGTETLLSKPNSKVQIWLVPTNEELVIAQVVGALLKAISHKVETPSNAFEFARQVEDLLTENDSLSLTDIRHISRNFIDNESVDEIFAGAHLKYGISLDDDLSIECKRLARYAKEVVTKARIAEGVSLLVSNPNAKLSSIDVKSTKDGFRAVVDIKLIEA